MEKTSIAAIACIIIGTTILLLTKPEFSPNLVEITGDLTNINNNKIQTATIITELSVINYNSELKEGRQTIRGRIREKNQKIEIIT